MDLPVGTVSFTNRPSALSRLRRSAMRAPEHVIEDQLASLQRDWRRWARRAGPELDLVEALLEYRLGRREFLDGSAARDDLDEIIHHIAESEPGVADREFLAWQVRNADPAGLAQALPLGASDHHAALGVMRAYAQERLRRATTTVARPLADALEHIQRVAWHVEDLEENAPRPLRTALRGLAVVAALACCLATAGLASALAGSLLALGRGERAALALASLALAAVVFARPLGRVVDQLDRWEAQRRYERRWRRELLDLVTVTRMGPPAIVSAVRASVPVDGEAAEETWALFLEDPTLAFYGLAKQGV